MEVQQRGDEPRRDYQQDNGACVEVAAPAGRNAFHGIIFFSNNHVLIEKEFCGRAIPEVAAGFWPAHCCFPDVRVSACARARKRPGW
jgi:hypothetical protein